jgi:putative peptidoglycan lipid II flippase
MNLIFIPQLAHVGLALSVGLGACFNAGFLFLLLKRHGIYQPQPGWFVFFFKQAVALILMAGLAVYLSSQFNWIAMQSHSIYRTACLAGILVLCMSVYFVSLFAMGFRFRDFKRMEKKS